MKSIFCVEDDLNIRELLEYTLKAYGFSSKGFETGASFLNYLKNETPSLILLDIMLPDIDGIQILTQLKSNSDTKDIPIIMLTAKSGRIDKIKGLDYGADDYITKPFDVLELISRINAVLRRSGGKEQEEKTPVKYKEMYINTESRVVTIGEDEIVLTYKEFELLHYLVINKGIVLSRDKLMNEVWGTDFEGESRTVDVHIRSLRQKLGLYGDYIVTVRNVGYKVDN